MNDDKLEHIRKKLIELMWEVENLPANERQTLFICKLSEALAIFKGQ